MSEHTHDHTHENMKAHTPEEAKALLAYMIEHNEHHSEDLHELFHALEDAGKSEAATFVLNAMHSYDDGNDQLQMAMKLLG